MLGGSTVGTRCTTATAGHLRRRRWRYRDSALTRAAERGLEPETRHTAVEMPDTPATMIAVEIAGPGGPEVLRAVRRPVPRPGPGEVLIEVAAAGVNRPDVMQRLGKYPPPPGASD